jgi:hypothetical protein
MNARKVLLALVAGLLLVSMISITPVKVAQAASAQKTISKADILTQLDAIAAQYNSMVKMPGDQDDSLIQQWLSLVHTYGMTNLSGRARLRSQIITLENKISAIHADRALNDPTTDAEDVLELRMISLGNAYISQFPLPGRIIFPPFNTFWNRIDMLLARLTLLNPNGDSDDSLLFRWVNLARTYSMSNRADRRVLLRSLNVLESQIKNMNNDPASAEDVLEAHIITLVRSNVLRSPFPFMSPTY